MSEPDGYAYVQAVQEKYTDALMHKQNVVGVAVGLVQASDAHTQELAIVVMVARKVPVSQLAPQDIIPKELEGVRVDVQETGLFAAQ